MSEQAAQQTGQAVQAGRAGAGNQRPVALVTGGSRGIGKAVVADLAKDHHVIVGATTKENAEKVARECESAEVFVADLSDPEQLAAEFQRVFTDGARLDVVVHSAGIYAGGAVEELSHADWMRVLNLNVAAVAELTRLALPLLRASKGMVVTINSGSGFRASPTTGAYAASKFALRAFTDALREEERGEVRVSSVHPGRVDTDMQVEIQGAEDYDGAKYVQPASIAKAVRLSVDAGWDCNVDEVSVRPRA